MSGTWGGHRRGIKGGGKKIAFYVPSEAYDKWVAFKGKMHPSEAGQKLIDLIPVVKD
jgi:hypothetical protein